MRRLAMMVAIVAMATGGMASVASGATTIGWDETGTPPVFDVGACPPRAYIQVASADKTYLVPDGGGVITSFSVYGWTAGVVQLQLLRVVSFYQFLAVGESGLAPVFAGHWNTFETRIPAEAGDHIILTLRTSGFYCLFETGNEADLLGNLEGSALPFPFGSLVEVKSGIDSVAINLAATVEADPDRDGWGNETQDNCPVAPGPDHGCPLPPVPSAPASMESPRGALKAGLTIGPQDILRRRGLRLTIRTGESASFVAAARVKALGSDRAWGLPVSEGSVQAGTPRVVKLKLSHRIAAALSRAIENGARLKAVATVGVTGVDGDTATIEQAIAVRGS